MGEEMNDIVTYREAEPDARVEGIIAKNNENRVWWQAFCAMTQSLPVIDVKTTLGDIKEMERLAVMIRAEFADAAVAEGRKRGRL